MNKYFIVEIFWGE